MPADLITTGVLASANYVQDVSGFSIDTAGTAELNNAHIRGVLESSEIKGSVMVASSRVIPTENETAFFTLENERPITYKTRTISQQKLILGPMMVVHSSGTRRFNDGGKIILAADNPIGTVPGGINNEYTRFWARTPLIKAQFRFDAQGEPWGENITHGKIQVTLKTSGGRELATSPLFRLNQNRGLGNIYYTDTLWSNPKRNRAKTILLPYAHGFHHSSIIRVNREVVVHSSQNKSYTKSLSVHIGAGASFRHNTASDNDETGLMLEITFDFSEDFPTTGSQTTKVLNGFYFSTDIQATTHS